ncbi:MAG: FtsX-like permease family protein [Bacteroidota bacterium]
MIINETAAKNLGLTSPVGEQITWELEGAAGPLTGNVIGLVKDFHYQSLHEPVRPLLFKLSDRYNHILIKINSENVSSLMAEVETVWQQFEDRFIFEYTVLSDELDYQYVGEQKTAEVFGGFSAIAIFIAAFGLFGIASISFQRRKKEVSIRKVMGASVARILILLLKDFTNLILIAVVLAIPLAWWVMNNWLQNFTFRITMSPTDFLISALSIIFIAWLTVLYLTVQTASKNPIDSLKEE